MIQEIRLENRPRGSLYLDIAFPGNLSDDILRGEQIKFYDMINNGIVLSFITIFEEIIVDISNGIKNWVDSLSSQLFEINFDDEQKKLNRFIEISKNNKYIDFEGLFQLFSKVCICSKLSQHSNENNQVMVTRRLAREFTERKITVYYLSVSSLPDLIEGERFRQIAELGLDKLWKKLKKDERERKLMENDGIEDSRVYFFNSGPITGSNFVVGSHNNGINQTISKNDLKEINELINKLEKSLDDFKLSEDQKNKLLSEINLIKNETNSPSSTWKKIGYAFSSIRGMLQAIPNAQEAIHEIIKNIEHLLKITGSH